jgi:hypothetical protein
MPAKRKRTDLLAEPPRRNEFDDTQAVTEWLNTLEPPMKPLIELIRPAVLTADSSITEGIKWKTASFYCHGWFATVNTRAKTGIQLVLHHGAKIRADSTLTQTINDSAQLLTWVAKDRATITFLSTDDFQRKRLAFKKIIKQWAKYQGDHANP